MDKRRMALTVNNTKMDEFLELNRMAFSDNLPRNSESRAIGICLRWIKKEVPKIKWVVSFADATQCGDGTIYRASGFKLIQINKNKTLLRLSNGTIIADKTLNDFIGSDGKRLRSKIVNKKTVDHLIAPDGHRMSKGLSATPLKGFQLKYIYFLHEKEVLNLVPSILSFKEIGEKDAAMYKGKSAGSIGVDASGTQLEEGGSIPTPALQN